MRTLLLFAALLTACAPQSSTELPELSRGPDPDDGSYDTREAELSSFATQTTLTVAFDRLEQPGADLIIVVSQLRNGATPITGALVTLSTPDGLYSEVIEAAPGVYVGYVLPLQPTGHVRVRVAGGGRVVKKTALALAELGPHWGQPEPVPGLVNTPGYEDSAEVSPDGEWLLVSDYSPVDMVCCIFGSCDPADLRPSLDPSAPHCNNSLGPIGGKLRPRLPGRSRIVSLTQIHDEAPSLGYDQPDGVDLPIALPPLTSYGFRRQPDGSFGAPFQITFANDGVGTPFGYTFAAAPVGTAARLVFAYDDLRNIRGDWGPPMGPDLFHADVSLGVDTNLGTYSLDAQGRPITDRFPAAVPLPDRVGQQGNPSVSSDGIWFDTETAQDDIFFAAGDPLGAATLATPRKVALSTPERKETQPYWHGDRLYYAIDQNRITSSARAWGGDPALASTWGPERLELASEASSRVGAVIAIGEPSISVHAGIAELYFVYVVKTATGLDVNVGRVRAR
ncbi:MAG: hypothetical protein R3B48_02120 [Kofleriaceae bacterium]